ncbi:MAG TPA: diacylglycerol kinase family protein [Ktedonosporobacter sp.]|nr:diacylglycerol kinase family protein [Ktedonosporobacter sp.]
MRAVVIMNSTSGTSAIATKEGTPLEHEVAILAALRTHGIEAEMRQTTQEDSGAGVSAQAAAEQVDVVIAAGGDGTVHAVARGLIGTQSALGIIALGTMNNLAHSLNLPVTIEEACAVIATGETHAIDAGLINDQFFLEVVGVGLEAALFAVAEEVKGPGFLVTLGGLFKGLRILLAFQSAPLRISFDEHRRRPYTAIQVTICNARYYGAHFELVPRALMDDGLLDVVIFKQFNKLDYIRHALSISQGRRTYQPRIMHRQVTSVRISAKHPLEIQADGRSCGQTPATVTITPGALRVRVRAPVERLRLPDQVPQLSTATSCETQTYRFLERRQDTGTSQV